MAYIFISYRQLDSEGYVGRLFDRLEKVYSKQKIFRDLDSLRGGDHFTTACEEEVKNCEIFLAVIGPQWINIRNDKGQRRLDNPNDAVRGEIYTAIRHGKRIVPVLVGRAQIPRKSELPKDISSMVDHKAMEISPERFEYDVERLIEAIGGGDGVVQMHGKSRSFGIIPGYYEKCNIFIDNKKIEFYPVNILTLPDAINFPLQTRIKAGIHRMYAQILTVMENIETENHVSEEIQFEIKAGQTIRFILERDTSPFDFRNIGKNIGRKTLLIKPYNTTIYRA